MKNLILILSVIFLIFAGAGFLFWKGEKVMNEATSGHTIIAFADTNNNLSNGDSANIFNVKISNLEKKQQPFKIELYLNEDLIESSEIKIDPMKTQIFQPNQNIGEKINNEAVYRVVVGWGSRREEIYKKVYVEKS